MNAINGDTSIFSGAFFEHFLVITHWQTLVWFLFLLVGFFIIHRLGKHKKSFFMRMMVGLILGIALGFSLQLLEGMPENSTTALKETALWYGLFGRSFISLIRMLVIPLVFVSILKVVLDFAAEKYLSKIATRGIFWLLFTTGLAAIVGILLANILGLGQGDVEVTQSAVIREQSNIVNILVGLIPSNIITAMHTNNVVGLVIFSALLGVAANKAERKLPEEIALFKSFINALHRIVMSVTSMIIKLMPYAIIALLAGTVMSNGIPAIINVSSFIVAIYAATLIMILIHILLVMMHGLSPVTFIKKARDTWVMAFSSRSSMGTLPMSIATLTERMGVSSGTANLIPSLGATMGMNGCAGFFPALLVMMVANMIGIEMNLQFYIMLLIVVVIGSIGVAGIPGTATIAATISLSGMGLGEYFPLIGMVLAIDPIIDMGRTLANVSGAMTAALITDKEVGMLDENTYNNPGAEIRSDEDLAI
ncbi:MAG: cation:dicarboxylase symporter family transporter [Xanthomonadaceae bacterium]|nr:cation:dicarboxylase symporter family transporter [Xanthomonadaceae bacterium]